MADLERLRRRKISAQGWLTRSVSKIEQAVSSKEVKLLALSDLLDDFDKRLVDFDVAEAEYEQELSETDIADAIETAGEVRDRAILSKQKAVKLLSELKKMASAEAGHEVRSDSASDKVRLPKLQLPKFSGDVLKWPQFWDSFSVTVDSSDMSDVTKLTYLRSLLTGEASRCVEGMALCSENYGATCKILEERFGRKEQIVFGHIQALLQVGQTQKQSLKSLQDELLVHVRSLETLDITGERYGVVLTPIIVSRLPEDVRKDWAREGAGKESDLDFLLAFLKKEINSLERSQAFSGLSSSAAATELRQPGQRPGQRARRETSTPSAAALQTSSTSRPTSSATRARLVRCGFCSGSHSTSSCRELLNLEVPERRERVQRAGLCFLCLLPGHIAKYCSKRCSVCQGKHNELFCFQLSQNQTKPKSVSVSNTSEAPMASHQNVSQTASLSCVDRKDHCERSHVVLPTAKVNVQGSKGTVSARLVLDSGSQRTFVGESLVRKVGAEFLGTKQVSYTAFGGSKSDGDRGEYMLNVSGANLSRPTYHSFSAIQVPVICPPLSRPCIPSDRLQGLAGLELADQLLEGDQLSVDILCGLDVFWALVKPGATHISDGLAVMESVFGWVLCGAVDSSRVSGESVQSAVCSQLLTLDLNESTVRSFWELETIGIVPQEESVENNPVLQSFDESVQFSKERGRYQVRLPWKKNVQGIELINGQKSAGQRLDSLNRKLARDSDLKEGYDLALREMETNGVIQEIPVTDQAQGESDVSHPVFYLPHRPVVRESSLSTRIRPVFDASAREVGGVSLNDCLHVGPSLTPNICDVLSRFRRHQVAVVADISKAFLNIELQEEDADVQRLLWDVNGVRRHMKVGRVLFGINSSPFLLNATIRHHLSLYQPPSEAVIQLQDQLYVDDFLGGSDTEEGAWDLFTQARDVLAEAGMPLTKCASNSKVVFDRARAESVSLPGDSDESLKVLGVRWSCQEDCFLFDGITIPDGVVTTKRVVLSCIARFFEPLGFLAPFLMKAKCLFQELWKLGVEWDEPVPPSFQQEFVSWVQDLQKLKEVRIPRCFVSGPWSDVVEDVEVHGYGDASLKGYGAVIYIRSPDRSGDGCLTSLVMSKVRVAPLRKVTLARLELLAALLVARLVSHVIRALRLPQSCVYRCWSDSQVALAWIRGDPDR